MGNSQSSSSDPHFISASRAFTQNELQELKSVFTSLASKSDAQFISPSVFKGYVGIEGPLGDRLYNLITRNINDEKLTFEDLVMAKGTYEKGSINEIEEFIYQLLDVSADGFVGRSDLEAVLRALLDYIFSDSGSGGGSCQEIVEAFINSANFSTVGEGSTANSMSFEDFRSWCALVPSVRKFLGTLLKPSDPGSQVPQLLNRESIDANLILLRKEYAWHIGGALAQDDLEEWKLLYHSSLHGLSFNTFLGNISHKGPTILIIKDKEGHVYGGYASQAWERHGDFYGDMKSFLFQLFPKAAIFRPTGANHNIQWCAVNFSSDSIPNGIGFGGRVHHFGLFLSGNFDQGHSFACTTFGSPCLSKTNKIFPDTIECWGITPKKPQGEIQDSAKGTVLERFKEDRHMLNMVGLANSSE
ncbi:hypothetical protein LIER_29276 [Lithospermum erythrorhizon]|uniref:TLDc domain-containing protein n=1 Tax=Lithospermum erythrorhizon TaxID=34254 RepID=A0AAV3RLM7_LITER